MCPLLIFTASEIFQRTLLCWRGFVCRLLHADVLWTDSNGDMACPLLCHKIKQNRVYNSPEEPRTL